MKRAGITGCVVNGTTEADWETVSSLAQRHPGFIRPAFGLHPWYLSQRTPGWLDSLRRFLDLHPEASVGECGVDGWMDGVTWDEQIDILLPHLAIARERELPITLHALKAWPALEQALQAEAPPSSGFLLHSFGGSPQQARQWAKMGAFFSFSGYFLHARKAKVLESYRHIPTDRLLLETDAPSMTPPTEWITHPLPESRNHPANLPAVASGLARCLDLPCSDLIALCDRNATRFFGTIG
ncbi:TatD DNase family protein [Haloferula luteola]|uniref:TatD DNase family protein n=2 Tax=Haloferula luteola TaxID=595692 RepID=A0A840V824_9BACT|nr:TatD DNase family protein [Haloferula luteola]